MSQPSELHAAYCSESGRDITYAVWERAFFDFLKTYTVEDLRLVIKFIKAKNSKMSGAAYSLLPQKLFDFEYMHFDGLLSEAKAWNRNRKPAPTPAQQIKQAFSPVLGEDLTSTATTHAAQTAIIQALSKK